MTKPQPPRIHVLLARKAPVGLVIRRGPSKQVCTFLWNRRTDRFTLGQWLKGHIHERRSDLSPDGRHWIYFAINGRWESETRGAYSAIARAPYLKAIGLWAKGDGWHGGGLFVDEKSYWLNSGRSHQAVRTPGTLKELDTHPGEYVYGGEDPGVYYLRLKRDGWSLVNSADLAARHAIDTFEKPMPRGGVLRKFAHCGAPPAQRAGRSPYYDEHELETATGQRVSFSAWEWADLDGTRLVWAESGKLFAGSPSPTGVDSPKELYDFNNLTFEPIEAPY